MFDVGLYYGYGFSIGGYNHDDIAGLDTGLAARAREPARARDSRAPDHQPHP